MYRLGEEEIEAIAEVIRSQKFSRGNKGNIRAVYNFEKEMREYMGADYFFVLTSGKAALISALTAMGIGPGDEVIVPAYTYIATAVAVLAVGAIPVIVDVDETLTIDPKAIEANISKYTKAIIPVHMQGMPSNMDAIMDIAKKHNLYVLEDACQAVGASYKGKMLGTIGDAGAYSFNSFKNITAGEGGGVITNNTTIYENAFIYHDSSGIAWLGNEMEGFDNKLFVGTEYRVSEITGAMLRVQLKRLDGIVADLRENKKKVMDAIKDTGLKFAPSNDPEGDCGNIIPMTFDDVETAQAFLKEAGDQMDILSNMGRHIYSNWESIMLKRGAVNPKNDPFLRPENQGLNMNYTPDMCQKTIDLLARTVILFINPDWTDDERQKKIDELKAAAAKVLK